MNKFFLFLACSSIASGVVLESHAASPAFEKKPNIILVITDDVHLDFGYLRIRKQGSDGGHNGLRDIQDKLESNQYPRLRVGIGANYSKGRQADFVLSPWNPDEERMLPTIVDRATKAVIDFATQGLEKTMNRHNGQIS